MCGLVALLSFNGSRKTEETLGHMLDPIAHRGPDDSGISIDGAVALGFRRLSILDLSPLGHQPMHAADGGCTIVFNGEIYNYFELRKELQALGHSFRSTGDTEVLLAAYRQWGANCLARLNGMWAFVIHDRARNKVFGARDRFGIKPLYRWHNAEHAVFASEIKSIRASGLYPNKINLQRCAAFLHEDRLDDTGETFFEGIVQVPAGHAFKMNLDGRYRAWSYWDFTALDDAPGTNPASAYADLFEDAIRIHMRSDVPVGVNLSGGLDSTSILCAAARVRTAAGADSPLLAFCYMDPQFDERRYIDDTLALTGAQLIRLEATPQQLWDSLPAVLGFQDEPVHSMTALVGYQLMALAAQYGVKVILNGQGADEVLGGYGSYFADRWAELIRRGALAQVRREIEAYTVAHGGSVAARFGALLRRVTQQSLSSVGPYRLAAAGRRGARARARTWLRQDLIDHLGPYESPTTGTLDSVLRDAVTRTPLPLYLRVEDRNSMAHSIEVRLPFLDPRLVQLAFSLGPQWKVNGPWNKYLLREAMRGRIPESVCSRIDKMGFPTDVATWLRGPLYGRMRDVIHDRSFREQEFFDPDVLASDLEAHRNGRADHSSKLFTAAQFHVWLKSCAESAAPRSAEPALP